MNPADNYRGRLAPSPTGYLHLGHARTFWMAQARAASRGGTMILRNEDLDAARLKMEFVEAMIEDLRWFGFTWSEGPDVGGPFGPYNQSERMDFYRAAFERLRANGIIYPCTCSRKDIQAAVTAPHAEDDELIYPGTCRPKSSIGTGVPSLNFQTGQRPETRGPEVLATKAIRAWRFQVPDGETISFLDGNLGEQRFIAGEDFGDFIVWRGDGVPAYQLACVADDSAMRITEVVRGADLLVSTARQLLLYRALGWQAPQFFHCELMRDEAGRRLAKRHDALSLRTLRNGGADPAQLRAGWGVGGSSSDKRC
jgi:glutamyl-tRNA synthetase